MLSGMRNFPNKEAPTGHAARSVFASQRNELAKIAKSLGNMHGEAREAVYVQPS